MKRSFAQHILSTLLFIGSTQATASEIDDISTYYQPLESSESALNQKVQAALDGAHRQSKSCDLKAFGKAVAAELVSFRMYSGAIERFAWNDPSVYRIKGKVGGSVYGNSPFSRSVIGLAYGLDPVIAVGKIKFGSDKLGHFIDHGHSLYLRFEKDKNENALAAYSVDEEEGAFGWLTTGIKSYGDLASDMDGFSFWRDVFGQGKNPYASCQNGKLVKMRDFRFSEFVTPAWNEAINCNQYDGNSLSLPSLMSVQIALENMNQPPETCDETYRLLEEKGKGDFTKAVERNIAALEKQEKRKYQCPIDAKQCRSMGGLYQQRYSTAIATQILHPACKP